MERGWKQGKNREFQRSQWYRNVKFGQTYHPAFLWGRLIFLAALVVMFILWITDIVPYNLQPTVGALLVTIMLTGGILSIVGYFRYWGKGRTVIIIAVIFAVTVLMVGWALFS